MADVLSRLFGPTQLANGDNTFTGTAGHTYTVLDIRVVNTDSTARTFKAGIGGSGSTKLFIPATVIPAGGSLEWSGKVVLSDTEVLYLNASAATALTATVTGLDQS